MTTTSTATSPPTESPGPAKIKRKGLSQRRAILTFVGPFVVLFALFYIVPIAYAIYQSFLTVERDGTFGPATQVFGGFTQYVAVFQNDEFWASVVRVLLFGIVQVPIMLGLALLFALLLDSPLLKGKKFFRLAFFAPYAVPGVIAAIMWGFLYSPTLSPFAPVTQNVSFLSADLILWSIANIVTWVYVGYNMLIIYSALLAIPTEIYEAAKLDGANNWQVAWKIKIPLVTPAIILTAVFSIIGTLQLLAEPQTLRSFSTAINSTFTPNLAVYTTASVPNYSLAAAMSVVLALATFALSFAFLKATQKKAFA
ncbi:carbohydrate ABC transporter permease [Marisediminicola antarctica]|uniref:ABC transporter permease n=1 Tax=Marisediminicola antarctica TaxID=674079 RepID=A0A7L5AHM7_9MICO|nr:sugar ABC transporter permease [Marisediminicola antarctica]QHO70073.1 ABC transporter permease [Marisediminicola antarctica]